MPFLFENLDVYRRAVDLADDLVRRAAAFPRGHRVLADQLTRAAISIATNIAEGNGRFAPGDRGQFFGIARGSAHECVALLELSRRRSLVNDTDHAVLYSELDEICRMINGLIRGIPKRKVP
ncbi:MAG: four helix bundle protein [Phycisphaerae bacterium]|nr:four helix bundle protein [Phycisphaerae bacterium]